MPAAGSSTVRNAIEPGQLPRRPSPHKATASALHTPQSPQCPPPEPCRFLVVGYGNELRTDDGAGPAVVRAVQKWRLPGVIALIRQQLTPELAETVTHYQRVVFVDAIPARSCPRPQITSLQPPSSPDVRTHGSHPGTILALAQLLYDRCPEAWILAVPAFSFAHGQGLSPRTRRILPGAVKSLRDLLSNR